MIRTILLALFGPLYPKPALVRIRTTRPAPADIRKDR
jgi:hypothetical protein